jgi:thiol-disulfide isomerase/thioredoxin
MGSKGEAGVSLKTGRGGESGRAEWWLLAGVVAFLSLVLVMWRSAGRHEAPAGGAVQAAPPFNLPTLSGARVSLATLRGKVVLVHFWATWCPPCVEEAPYLGKLSERLRGRPFELVAVSVDDTPQPVQAFFGTTPAAYTVAFDPGGTVAHQYGTFKYPETYLVGPQGQVLKRYIGAQDWTSDEIRDELEQALGTVTAPGQ